MNVSAMVRGSVKATALAALAALLLQAACILGPVVSVHVPLNPTGGSGCHESRPASPQVPDPGYLCCNGDHSPDALLSAAVTPVSAAFAGRISLPVLTLTAPQTLLGGVSIPVAKPPGQLALRI